MRSGKILVVEDEAFISHDIKRILEGEGYTALIDCFSVDMAIQNIEEESPDLVLIDINLGDRKSGLDLAEYLDKVVQIPYIFITSYSDKSTLRKVAEHAPSGYITKPFKPQDLISSVFLVMNKITVAEPEQTDEKVKEMPFAITQVLDYIDRNLSEKLDLNTLAAMTGWEPEHFGRIFKDNLGLTPYQYILKTKIERSKELLVRTNETLQAICFQLGFSNYSNFFAAFKKYMKMSPDQYRKIAR